MLQINASAGASASSGAMDSLPLRVVIDTLMDISDLGADSVAFDAWAGTITSSPSMFKMSLPDADACNAILLLLTKVVDKFSAFFSSSCCIGDSSFCTLESQIFFDCSTSRHY